MIRCRAGHFVADKTVHRSDIDDPAVFGGDHGLLGNGTRYLEGAEQVDIHLTGELVVCDVFRRSDCAGAGVVDQDINPSIFFQNLVNHFLDHLCICNIASDRESLYAELLPDLRSHFFNFLLSSRNRNNDSPLICKCFRHLNAQSAGTSGDNGNSSLKIKILFHVYLPEHL